MNPLNLNSIIELGHEPKDDQEFSAWLQQRDIVPFLERDGAEDDIIVYAGLAHVFVHAILIPAFDVTHEAVGPLLEWNFSISSG